MRLTQRLAPTVRAGFTLVELLVATALIIMILAIISVAFHTGIDSFRTLKAVGDMAENLRIAQATLRRDLSTEHLEAENGAPILVSDARFNGIAWHPDASTTPPGARGRMGYFVVRQPSPPRQAYNPSALDFVGNFPPYNTAPLNTLQAYETYPYLHEGTEDGVPSYRATDHTLAFTMRLPGNSIEEVFSCRAPANMLAAPLNMTQFADASNPQFVSPWAEVAYFLRPSGALTNGEDGTSLIPLYTLHRRIRVLSPSPVRITTPPPTPPNSPNNSNYWREFYSELSIATTTNPASPAFIVNTPETVNQPDTSFTEPFTGRLGTIVDWRNYSGAGAPVPIPRFIPAGLAEVAPNAPGDGTIANADRYGSDVVLNNVVSFHVQVMTDASRAAGPPYWTDPGTGAWPRTYDTANSAARILAIRVVLRVYDTKMKLTRQATLIQDL